jgi:hypothetical protein
MVDPGRIADWFCCRVCFVMLGVLCLGGIARANRKDPVNEFGWPLHDANGCPINYDQAVLVAAKEARRAASVDEEVTVAAGPAGFVPSGNTTRPFWQYPVFGSNIGQSNIIIAPPNGSGQHEMIFAGSSHRDAWPNDFWQVLRYDPLTSQYESVFCSQIYTSEIRRIALGNILGDSQLEIVVLLQNGRIYVYDLGTKTELGYINTGITNGLGGLSLTDLDGDGYAELIVSGSNLTVFTGNGELLWQVAGVGGPEIVVGQMDNDPALEIATFTGSVVDSATHTVQWTRPGGLGNRLRLAPFPGASYQQLIGAQGYAVNAYDVGNQLTSWSISTPYVDALEVADVDNDGVPEVITGDDQFGSLHVYDLINQTQRWQINNPGHYVTYIAVGDADGDGIVDLIWGADNGGPEGDHIFVASTTGAHIIKWQNVDLVGPFLGPLIGDLDGDGQPELVACSWESNENSGSGRILVFDPLTLRLRGISPPIVNNNAWDGVRDFKLCDLEGDGRMEIAVAADQFHSGAIEIYSFSSSNTFTRRWTNTVRPNIPYDFVEVVDLNGNGTPEIIGSNRYIDIFDYPSTTNPWRSGLLTPQNETAQLVIGDIAGTGVKKIAALLGFYGGLYTFDGPTRQLEYHASQIDYGKMIRRIPAGLIRTDYSGVGHFLRYANNNYSEDFSRQLGSSALDGVNLLPNGELWTVAAGILTLRVPPYTAVAWQSPQFGDLYPGYVYGRFGRFATTDFVQGRHRVFSSSSHAIAGFEYEPGAPAPTIAVSRKSHGAAGDFDVALPLSGAPGIECRTTSGTNDYVIVVTFPTSISVNGSPQAQVISGTATVGIGGVFNGGMVTTSGNSVNVPLTNVANAQTINVRLNGVTASFGSGNVTIPMSILVGNINANGSVNATEVAQAKAWVGLTLNAVTFRADINANGAINSGDVSQIKSVVGTGLP